MDLPLFPILPILCRNRKKGFRVAIFFLLLREEKGLDWTGLSDAREEAWEEGTDGRGFE